jgi:hypothetical protein
LPKSLCNSVNCFAIMAGGAALSSISTMLLHLWPMGGVGTVLGPGGDQLPAGVLKLEVG